MEELYPLLANIHWFISRAGVAAALVMVAIAVYIGIVKKRDVTLWFRRVTYVVAGVLIAQALLGFAMWGMGGRPAQDVHMIYGIGVALSLPFFIFVEVTAKKRPSMGSYIWGFAMVFFITVRSILTGS